MESSLSEALAAAQKEIGNVTRGKTGQVGNQKYKYADLGAVLDEIRKPLTDHGLSFQQLFHPNTEGVHLSTRVTHISGESLEDDGIFLPVAKRDPQGFGSAATYARRYSLCAMFGIAQEDDDGQSASTPQRQQEKATPPVGGYSGYLGKSVPASQLQPPTQGIQQAAVPSLSNNQDLFPMGKHKGEPYSEVPTSYLEWCLKNVDPHDEKYGEKNQILLDAITNELTDRIEAAQPQLAGTAVGHNPDDDIGF